MEDQPDHNNPADDPAPYLEHHKEIEALVFGIGCCRSFTVSFHTGTLAGYPYLLSAGDEYTTPS